MRFDRSQIMDKLLSPGLLPLYYNDNLQRCKDIIVQCYHAGISAFEFTNRGAYALAHFAALTESVSRDCPGLALGAGTIYDMDQAAAFADAGADFIVQPICDAEVGTYCNERGIAWIPGAMTLTEIYAARKAGATMVKVFPGNVLGPAFIKAIRGPLPHVPLMITGGVEATPENILEWRKAGVQVCGLGSQLFAASAEGNILTDTLRHLIDALEHTNE